MNPKPDNNERNFLDLLLQPETRIKAERFTPESETELLALTKEARKHAKAKKWQQANLAVRTVQTRWPKLNRRPL
jgi:hypothetical protein